ncbi:MAG: hypothetical protein ACRD2E_00410 [Terriglobales bacterium]
MPTFFGTTAARRADVRPVQPYIFSAALAADGMWTGFHRRGSLAFTITAIPGEVESSVPASH